jgi:hypothetical protein
MPSWLMQVPVYILQVKLLAGKAHYVAPIVRHSARPRSERDSSGTTREAAKLRSG